MHRKERAHYEQTSCDVYQSEAFDQEDFVAVTPTPARCDETPANARDAPYQLLIKVLLQEKVQRG
jgi:hypothetical protein